MKKSLSVQLMFHIPLWLCLVVPIDFCIDHVWPWLSVWLRLTLKFLVKDISTILVSWIHLWKRQDSVHLWTKVQLYYYSCFFYKEYPKLLESTKTFELNKMAVHCFHFTTLSSKGSRNIQNHLNLLLDPKDCRWVKKCKSNSLLSAELGFNCRGGKKFQHLL